jgi:hypothetical protein
MNNVPAAKPWFTDLIQVDIVVKYMDQAIGRFSALGISPFYSRMPPPNLIGKWTQRRALL